MYRKILLPLDGSREAEMVMDAIKNDVAPDCTIILLKVIPLAKTLVVAGEIMDSSSLTAGERSKAMDSLRDVVHRLGDPARWRCQVEVSESVAQGILDCAAREGVDLIAMYTHDRKGLARMIKGSIARDVQRKAPIEVKVFKPRELALV